MTKQDIFKEIEWRIKDLKEQQKFWIKKLDELPSHDSAVEKTKMLMKIANEKAAQGENYAYTEAWNYVKKCDEDINKAHYNAFLAMIRVDILERLYETIKSEE